MDIPQLDSTFLFQELLTKYTIQELSQKLFLHIGTLQRWQKLKVVPNNYFNDLNRLLDHPYDTIESFRTQDQFFTKVEVAKLCFDVLNDFCINHLKITQEELNSYIFLEPSAGEGSFYNLLPNDKRIGVDLMPQIEGIIKNNFLDYLPDLSKKYIVIGNPPFGLRGNLALRFINHANTFVDIVAFILPPLFESDGKGNPRNRVEGYTLAYTMHLPTNSFQYPNGVPVDVATIFQIWTKIKLENIVCTTTKKCDSFVDICSISNGKTSSSQRNVKMIGKCDFYLPSTCFKGMKLYDNFYDLPNQRGYGIVIKQKHKEIIKLFQQTNWELIAFKSTNSALNLRTNKIKDVIINAGFNDD